MVYNPFYDGSMVLAIFVLGFGLFWLSVYIKNRKKIHSTSVDSNFQPNLTIIVPAYNEERNIDKCLKAIFNTAYPKNKIEIIVIDDGSNDKTEELARKYDVRFIKNEKNMGKIFSLNRAIDLAKNDIIITTDADTELEPQTIGMLAKHFEDPDVGAVSGIYKTKRVFPKRKLFHYLLEKAQSLEYLMFAFTRKQQEAVESILVVPGAIAAYRKEVVKEAGGFENDTLIEDYDMTIKIHKLGKKIRCDKDAIAWVLAPQTLGALIRERNRWYRGGLQVLKKHADILMSSRLGFVKMVWVLENFGMMLQLIIFAVAISKMHYMFSKYPLADMVIGSVMWTYNIIMLDVTVWDGLLIIGAVLIVIGMINIIASIGITHDRKRKLFMYPFMMIYSTGMVLVFIYSFFQELLGVKSAWKKAEL